MLRAPLLDSVCPKIACPEIARPETARPGLARRAMLRLGTVGLVVTAVTFGVVGLGAPANAATLPTRVPAAHHSAGHVPTAKPTLHGAASVAARRAAFGKSILHEAARHSGAPYVYGASGPGAFDCSGFTRYVFAKMGISLAHSSYSQYSETRHIPQSQALPGDIVFLNGLGHVGIYAGHGMMYDAPSPGGRVSLRPIYSSAYSVGRVLL